LVVWTGGKRTWFRFDIILESGTAHMIMFTRRVLCCSLIVFAPLAARASELPVAKPEEVGISKAKLEAVAKLVEKMVNTKKFAGAVTMVVREGQVIHLKAVGKSDIAKSKPMTTDAIFRIYSMTKPVTTAAAMMLVEEKKLALDDPLSKYLPELKDLRVYAGPEGEAVPAKREVTIRDLMRHTSGFTYGFFSDTPVDKLYREKGVATRGGTLQEFVTKLATLPLLYQPGTKFHYSVSTDVLGRVVEVVSGQSLDVFFAERIFKPLDMVDTAFSVPADKVDRFTTNYGPGDDGKLRVIDDPATSSYLTQPTFLSGGGGLVSTARDYARFCQMLLNGGELAGTRLLKSETVELMNHNQLPTEALPMTMPSIPAVDKGLGFGFGFGVRMAKSALDPTAVVGEYYWGGAASTGFTICPKNQTVIITLTQYMPFTPALSEAFKRGVNAVIAHSDRKPAVAK
jgi:CubicO group peptidase (beta-lactamase class C family)